MGNLCTVHSICCEFKTAPTNKSKKVIQCVQITFVRELGRNVIKDQRKGRDFPGGAVVKNLPANAWDTGSIPLRGRFHIPRSN